jgi:hypothetical protein
MIKFIDEKEAIEKYGKGLETPVLYIPFSRLDLVEKAFGQIKKVKPKKLYIAQDGPREHVEGEKKKILAVRDYMISNIDWDCEVKTLFREKNMGMREGIIEALNWFFENEEQGIVLEEDIYMSLSGFWFLEKMLNKFKHDEDVWFVCAYNIVDIACDYAKTDNFNTWGWAGWKDKWIKVRYGSVDRNEGRFLDNYFENKRMEKFYKGVVNTPKQWLIRYGYDVEIPIELIYYKKYSIVPNIPLCAHLGFEEGATFSSEETYKLDVFRYNIALKDLKEIDIEQLEGCDGIIKTFEKNQIMHSHYNIFMAIYSKNLENNIKDLAGEYKNIAIYGAGILGYLVYATYDDLLSDKVRCFIDDNPKDIELMGKPILKPQDMPDSVDMILVSPQSKYVYENLKAKIDKQILWLKDLAFSHEKN